MANSAGNVPKGNQGQTDMDRGSSMNFPFNKSGRKTGKIGAPTPVPNSNKVDGNVRKAKDPRLV